MKILLWSDGHGHMWRQFGLNKETGLPRRVYDQLHVLKQIGQIIRDRKVERVLNGGDTIHKVGEISTEVLNFFDREFTQWNVPQDFVDGNHDIVDRADPAWYHSAASIFNKIYGYKGDDKTKIKLVGYAAKEDEVEGIEGYDIVVIHKTPRGAVAGTYKFDDGVDWRKIASKNRFVFFGHVHQRQQLADNCIVIGSPMHLTFGDIGDRGVYLLDTESWELEFIKLDYPEFLTVQSKNAIKEDDNYYRIFVSKDEREALPDNVLAVTIPSVYEQKIKSETFDGILNDWLVIKGLDSSYLNCLKGIADDMRINAHVVCDGRITEVNIKNFMSIENAAYKLPKGFLFIKGENGAGKSSCTGESVYWALFGETTKELEGDDVVRFDCRDCEVTVKIEGSKVIDVTRSRRKGLKVLVDGNELWEGYKESEKQKNLEQLLGFGKDFFRAACYFSQEGLETLSTMGDTDRTNMIVNLLGLSHYDTMYEQVFFRQKESQKRLDEDIKETEKIQQRRSYELDKVEDLKVQVLDTEKSLSSVTTSLAQSRDSLTDAKAEIETEMWQVEDKLKKAAADKDALDVVLGKERAIESEVKTIDTDIDKLKTTRSGFLFTIEKAQGSKKKLSALKGKCPTCENDVTDAHKATLILQYDAEIEKAMKAQSSVDAELKAQVSYYQEKKDELQKVKEERFKLEQQSKEKKSLLDKLTLLETKLETKEREIEAFKTREEQEKVRIKEKLLLLEGKVSATQKGLIVLEDALVAIKDSTEKHKKDVEDLEIWKEAFSSRGIKALLTDRFCNEFNNLLNTYISTASSGEFSAYMTPTTTLKSGEVRNKPDIVVVKKGRTRRYKSLSGGQKRRVDVAICLALNEWAGKRYGNGNGFLGLAILDEIFSFIDNVGEEAIATLLYQEGFRKTVVVISHTSDLASYAEVTWRVKMKNDVSVLETI